MCHLAWALPSFQLLFFLLSTPEVWYDPGVDASCLFRAAGDLLKEHSNRPVFPVKIGLASVKPTWRHRYNTHTSLIMRPSPSEPSFTSDVFPSSPCSLSSYLPFSPSCSDLKPFTSQLHQYFSPPRCRPFFCTFLLFPLDTEMLMLFGHERHAVDKDQRQPSRPFAWVDESCFDLDILYSWDSCSYGSKFPSNIAWLQG